MTKVSNKVSNHYVPQFLLKKFSNNSKSIGMYLNKKKKYIKEASIKEQACRDYLYGDDGKLEDMFMEIEGYAKKVIDNIIKSSTISSLNYEDYHVLLLFMLLSEARNIKAADSMENFMTTTMRIMAKMDKKLDIPDKVIDKMKITSPIPNLFSITTATELYPILLDLKCTLIINKTDRQFITSDNPFIRYNQMYVIRNYYRGYGLGSMGIQLFFPISPQICICVFDHILYGCKLNKDGNIEIYKGKQIDEINKLIILNSYEYLFFNDQISESYFTRLFNGIKHNSELKNEVQALGTRYDKVVMYSPKKVFERIKLPFSINKKFVGMSLPLHAAGPQRPYAEKISNDIKERRDRRLKNKINTE